MPLNRRGFLKVAGVGGLAVSVLGACKASLIPSSTPAQPGADATPPLMPVPTATVQSGEPKPTAIATAGPAGAAEILFEDDFSSGFNGWVGLRSGPVGTTGGVFSAWPSLSSEARSGASRSLILRPEKGQNRTSQAVKRVGVRDGIITWSGMYGWSAPSETHLRFIRWALDYQRGQVRYWFEVRYQHLDEATGSVAPRWQVETGNLEGPSLATIPGATYELGYNMERKPNFHRVDVQFDTREKRYTSLRVDDTVLDMSGLPGPQPTGPERPFANGLNFILFAQTRSDTGSGLYVLMDRPRATQE